jgi:hypothetical protein
MPSKPIEVPPAIAKAFVRDMRAFHAEKSPIKRDEIASRQIHVLRQFQGKNERQIKLHQVKADVRRDEGSVSREFTCARPEVAARLRQPEESQEMGIHGEENEGQKSQDEANCQAREGRGLRAVWILLAYCSICCRMASSSSGSSGRP